MAALAFAACDDDSFNDWSVPQANPDSTEDQRVAVTFAAKASPAVDFANLDEDVDTLVTVFAPELTSKGADADTVEYAVILGNTEDEVTATPEGQVRTADLRAAIERDFGKAPTERTVYATVVAYSHFGSVVSRHTADLSIVATLSAPVIETEYYLYGTAQGWSKEDKSLKFTRADESVNIYDDPIFTLTITASTEKDEETDEMKRIDEWFKIAPLSAFTADDFDAACLGSTTDGDKSLKVNLVNKDAKAMCQPATDGALRYRFTLDMMNYTLTVEPISFTEWIYVPGNGQNNWKPETAPALHSPAMDGVYKGFAYLDGEFKFTKERNWNAEYNKTNFAEFPENFAGAAAADNSNIACSKAGVYFLEIGVANGVFKATLIEGFGLIGPAQAGGWDADTDMTFDVAKCTYSWTGDLNAGEIKIRANDAWDISLGNSFDDLSYTGGNMMIEEAGNYTITFSPLITSGTKITATVTKN